MILRKPYAFLIKYFKIINFIIGVLSGYLIYRIYNISRFFSEYVTNNYSGNFYEGFYQNYITPILYLIIIIILIGLIGMSVLFIYKKKRAKIYIAGILYFIVLIIFLTIITNVMISMETNVMSAETSRLYRDISLIVIVPLIWFTIILLLRGFGFRINQFNFEADLRELEISDSDDEEIEITIKGDTVKLRRNIRRFIREFKYYVLENKIMVSILGGILLILIIYPLFNRTFPEVLDNNYKQGDTFSYNGLKYVVEDSIVTNLNYRGEEINKNKYYVAVKINIENTTKLPISFTYKSFRLMIGNNYIYPSSDKYALFVDYGIGNSVDFIAQNSKNSYVIVYEIDKKDIKNNYKIKIESGIGLSNKVLKGKYNYVLITPVLINKVLSEQTIKEDKEVSFVNSNLGNTTLTMSNISITDKYIYDYESCFEESCNKYKNVVTPSSNSNTLITGDYSYSIDKKSIFSQKYNSIDGLIDTFARVKYLTDDYDTLYVNVKSVIPTTLKDSFVIEVPKKAMDGKEVHLIFTIRNKEYSYKLK